MDDLISRKSLYDKMREAEDLARQRVIDTRSSFPDGSLNPAYIRYMAQLSERTRFKEMIYDEPSVERKRDEWIPLDISYPDMDERVLVFTVDHEYHVWDCMSNRADNWFWEDEEGLCHNKYEVDLWMPLPDPYKGDNNETN